MSPQDRQYFDVARPDQSEPSATSKPVIVGHRPQAADPMVNQRPAAPQPIDPNVLPAHPESVEHQQHVPVAPAPVHHPATVHHPTMQQPVHHETQQPENKNDDDHFNVHWVVWILLGLLGILITLYLLVDAGVIKGASHLPFHIFKQKETTQSQPATDSTASTTLDTGQTAAPSIPANWTTYQDKNIGYKLSYPKSWGVPVATNKAFEVYKFSKQPSILLDVGTKDFCPTGNYPQVKTSQGWYAMNNTYYLTWCKNNKAWDGKDYPIATDGRTVTPVTTAAITTYDETVKNYTSTGDHSEAEIIFNLVKNKTYSGLSIYRSWTAADKLNATAVTDEMKQVAATVTEL